VLGSPVVQYRGIFINDEGPALMTWARRKYGELNHGMYTNVFELILRCKGNYLWPAMWDNSFATDDPLNAKLADEYGVVISTSHHEPMMRAWKEWGRAGNRAGSWDYSKNDVKLREFWSEGLRRTKDYEKVITLAMRGDGDEPMSETESVALLERIVADQRKLISEIINPNLEEVPQVWALYKEVQGYYERGMRVPDDVLLLWCDDNWGNNRRLPTADERHRAGGAGIYYHFDYVGGPRNYKWINTVPLPKVWEQMNLAYHYGANRLWVVNIGDIKPQEVPLEFFLTHGVESRSHHPERSGRLSVALGGTRIRTEVRPGRRRHRRQIRQIQRPPQTRVARTRHVQFGQLWRSGSRAGGVAGDHHAGRTDLRQAAEGIAGCVLSARAVSDESQRCSERAVHRRGQESRPRETKRSARKCVCAAGPRVVRAGSSDVRLLQQRTRRREMETHDGPDAHWVHQLATAG
jgi:hypothetical protein